jgi:hypothetical protein
MKRTQKIKFRVGQTVQSIYDASRTFVIDRSAVPDRIFHEKGSDRWWTRNELRRLGASEDPATSCRLNGKEKMRGTHSNASPDNSGGPQIVVGVSSAVRKCLLPECGVKFEPARPWQKFHSDACRLEHWKRTNQAASATPEDTLTSLARRRKTPHFG